VYNASGSQIGFIGVESGNEGGWLKTLSVGGTSYANGKLKADSSGNVTINDATLTLNLNSVIAEIANQSAYGYTNGLRVYGTTSGQESPVMVAPGVIQIGNTLSSGTKFFVNGSFGSNTTMTLYDSNAAERFRLTAATTGGVLRVYGSSTSFASFASDGVSLLSGGVFSIGSSTGVTASTSVLTGLTVSSATVVSSVSQTTTTINYLDAPSSQTVVTNVNTSSTSVVTGVSYSTITLYYLDHSGNPQTDTVIHTFSSTSANISQFSSQSTVSLTRNSSTLVSNVSATTTSVGSASGLTSATFGFTGGIRTT